MPFSSSSSSPFALPSSSSTVPFQFQQLFLILHFVVLPTFQDSLFCGTSTYQVSLDPSRPAGIASEAGNGPTNPSSGVKYQFVGMDSLMRNVCALAPLSPSPNTFAGRLVITRCTECSKCPHELANIHRTLTRIALETGIQSLLIILNKDFEHVRSTARLVQDTMTKFVFLDEADLGSPTICELADTADGDSLKDGDALKSFSKTSVLFVSISFIILMVISLAWLVFYYVQRFRYAHAKDRLQRRLFNAAKKALAKIPTRPIKAGDKELSSDCPVCIDPYRQGDICRQLPCRHIFHKSCVDPWLLEHRTCPMCKSDILKAFGYHVNGRRRAQFSATVEEEGASGDHELGGHRGDRLSLDANSMASESANPFPVVTEVHDPFGFSPSTSPQLIQMVQQSPRSIQIVPLTVNVQTHHHPHQQSSPYCAIIQTSIERHSSADGDLAEHRTETGEPTPKEAVEVLSGNGGEHHHQQQQQQAVPPGSSSSSSSSSSPTSAGLPLFRAVTGRRHHIVNLAHLRSRSFSQSQENQHLGRTMPMSHSANGSVGTAADVVIYAMEPKGAMMPKEGKKPKKNSPTRALTAPSGAGGFRRKAPPTGKATGRGNSKKKEEAEAKKEGGGTSEH